MNVWNEPVAKFLRWYVVVQSLLLVGIAATNRTCIFIEDMSPPSLGLFMRIMNLVVVTTAVLIFLRQYIRRFVLAVGQEWHGTDT